MAKKLAGIGADDVYNDHFSAKNELEYKLRTNFYLKRVT
jgi:hypothetical protein